MPSHLKRLLLMNATAAIIFNYIGIFINLYIWEKNQRIFDVAWFNLVLFGSWGLTFLLGADLLTKSSIRVAMRVSAIFGGIAFVLLSWVNFEPKLLYLAILAIPVGATNGFYNAANNLGVSLFGKGREFIAFFSGMTIIGQIIAFLNPLLFAFVIKWIGFSGSFLLMFVFVAIMIACSFLLPDLTLSQEKEPLLQNFQFKKVFHTSGLKWMIPSLIAAGVFMQFQGVFSLLFTFSVTNDKVIIALLQIMYTCFIVLSMYMYKWFRNKLNDTFWLTLGMIAISIGFMIVLYPKAPVLIISNILTAIGMYFFVNIWSGRQFMIISQFEPIVQARIMVWRELLICVARIFMLMLILMIENFEGIAFKLIMISSFIAALTIPYFSKKGMERLEQDAGYDTFK